ncbi:MAG: hypothetical protein ABJG68_01315 [Crocinitomicaceae bacterium]
MIRSSRLSVFIVLSIFFFGCSADSNNTDKDKIKLESFLFTGEEFKNDCEILVSENLDDLPCGAASNPIISSDPEFVDCFSKAVLSEAEFSNNVERVLFSVYKGYDETGVFGFETNSEQTAIDIYEKLKNEINEDQGFVLQKENLVVLVWHDGEPCDCYYFIGGYSSVLDSRIQLSVEEK